MQLHIDIYRTWIWIVPLLSGTGSTQYWCVIVSFHLLFILYFIVFVFNFISYEHFVCFNLYSFNILLCDTICRRITVLSVYLCIFMCVSKNVRHFTNCNIKLNERFKVRVFAESGKLPNLLPCTCSCMYVFLL